MNHKEKVLTLCLLVAVVAVWFVYYHPRSTAGDRLDNVIHDTKDAGRDIGHDLRNGN